jgi:hypothetical protein
MARTVYDELADRLHGLAHRTAKAASPPVERGKVTHADPLVVEMIDSDLTLEEGDPDVEIDRGLLTDRPAVGDTVRVHKDGGPGGSDYVIAGVVE